jgi:hypothetical protein
VTGNEREVDRVGEDLAKMKLMYERDYDRRPPGPPACRLCHEIGHIARYCPYQPNINCVDMDSDSDFACCSIIDDSSDDDASPEVYASEKRSRDFQVQTKPRKRVAFDTNIIDPPKQSRLVSPPPRKETKSSFNYQAALKGADKTPPLTHQSQATSAGKTFRQQEAKQPSDQEGQLPSSSTRCRSTSSTGTAEKKEATRRQGASEIKKETLEKIAADYLKNKVVLDPLRHKDVSMKEVNATIADHLLQGQEVKVAKCSQHRGEPQCNSKSASAAGQPVITKRDSSCARDNTPTVAVFESDQGTTDDTFSPEEGYEDMPPLEPLDDSDEEEEDNSDPSDGSEEEDQGGSDDEGATVPSFRLINQTRLPTKPGKKWRYASGSKKPKVRQPLLPEYTSLRTTSFIGRYGLETIVDSGSSHSFITRQAAKEMGLKHLIKRTKEMSFTNADGSKSKARGVIRGILLRVGPLQAKMDLIVSKGGKYDILLGSDFLASIQAEIKYGRQQVRFKIGKGADAVTGTIKVHFGGKGDDSCLAFAIDPDPRRVNMPTTQGSASEPSLEGLTVEDDSEIPDLEAASDSESEGYGGDSTCWEDQDDNEQEFRLASDQEEVGPLLMYGYALDVSHTDPRRAKIARLERSSQDIGQSCMRHMQGGAACH